MFQPVLSLYQQQGQPSQSIKSEVNKMKKSIFAYKHNFQFQYVAFDGCIMWYSEQGEYIGTTDNSVFSACQLLDSYIKDVRGI